ncbi:MAG: hypothetical protein WDZ82_01515 [Candidatus Paceibacterota bacterium]
MTQFKKTVSQYYSDGFAVWVLGSMFLLSVGFYFYAINQTVYNVVERQDLQQELALLSSEIGSLEFEYIHQKNDIDLEKAKELGFVEEDRVTYITRPALGQAGGTQGSI